MRKFGITGAANTTLNIICRGDLKERGGNEN